MTRVLLTGGAGAIGSNLARALLERGDEVVVLDDLSSGHRTNLPPDAIFIEGDVTSDADVEAAMSTSPDRIIHLAALFANQNSVEHPAEDLLVNGLGTIKMLEAARTADVDKILFVSSSCVYGARSVMRESDPVLRLDTPYAITKLLGEYYATFWAEQHGVDVVSVRLFNVYGPFELPGRYRNVIPNFIARALRGEPLTITGTGEETRDFTFVGDTVRGLLLALDRPTEPGSLFNLASGRETSVNELATIINELTGNDAGVVRGPRRAWDHVTRRVGDIGLAREVLGYEPVTSLRDGLAMTISWLRAALSE